MNHIECCKTISSKTLNKNNLNFQMFWKKQFQETIVSRQHITSYKHKYKQHVPQSVCPG